MRCDEPESSPMTVCVPPELWQLVSRLGAFAEWPPPDEGGIDRFFAFALRQGLFGLLMADAALPEQINAARSRYRVREAVDHLRSRRSMDGIRLLQQVLGTDRVLLFKGADYRHRLYAPAHLRQMADVDILVEPGAFSRTLRDLERAGYPTQYASDIASNAPWASEATVMMGGVAIDIHSNFMQRIRANIDYRALWLRRQQFEADGLTCCHFAPADALLCHAFSPLAIDEFSCPLIRYVDFYLLLQRYSNEIPVCVERARQWGIRHAFFGALHVTSTLFPSARTQAVTDAMQELVSKPTRRLLINQVLPGGAARSCVPPIARREQLWRKFWLIDTFWRRVAFLLYHCFELVTGSWLRMRRRALLTKSAQSTKKISGCPPAP